MVGFLRNQALWVTLAALGLFALMVMTLGSDVTRDAVDLAAMFASTLMFFRLLPHALDRFYRGGHQANWQMIMGETLLWAGIDCWRGWAFAVRYYDRPDWMVEHWLNGFWPYWIVGAGVLCLRATRPEQEPTPTHVLYYLLIGLIAGLLIGVAAMKIMVSGAILAP